MCRSFPPKQIIDSDTTRGVLEGYAVMVPCRLFSSVEIDKLESLTAQTESYAKKSNHQMVVEPGGEFHDLLISKSSNIQLLGYTDRLSLKLHMLLYKHWGKLYSPAEIGNRHRAIVASLQSQDLAQIETVIRRHYAETGAKIAEL